MKCKKNRNRFLNSNFHCWTCKSLITVISIFSQNYLKPYTAHRNSVTFQNTCIDWMTKTLKSIRQTWRIALRNGIVSSWNDVVSNASSYNSKRYCLNLKRCLKFRVEAVIRFGIQRFAEFSGGKRDEAVENLCRKFCLVEITFLARDNHDKSSRIINKLNHTLIRILFTCMCRILRWEYAYLWLMRRALVKIIAQSVGTFYGF